VWCQPSATALLIPLSVMMGAVRLLAMSELCVVKENEGKCLSQQTHEPIESNSIQFNSRLLVRPPGHRDALPQHGKVVCG
jgi:hypothetical protein